MARKSPNRIDIDRFRVPAGGKRFRLKDVDPGSKQGLPDRERAEAEMADDVARIDVLQEIMYAQGEHALLCVFQAVDCGGKDGTIRKVFGAVDPIGIVSTSFKAPSHAELQHDYLWRVHKAVPPRGYLGIFNRSHYEDVLIVRVHNLAPANVIDKRYGEINAFEKELVKAGTKMVKFCLHISYDEQRQRLIDRLKDPDKHWKFKENDIDERALWDDYMSAYSIAITRCSEVPWYVIPANHKPYRNWAVSKILRETLEEMNPAFPQPRLNIKRLLKRLIP